MSLHAIQVQIQLSEINCGQCGGTYAINERYRQQKEQEGGTWHCPYCQTCWGYANDNENSRLKKRLAEETARREAALARANEADAELDKALKKLKRVAKGVCPDCQRTFSNLARHMACKHPKK